VGTRALLRTKTAKTLRQSHPGYFSLQEISIRGVMGLVVRFLPVLREELA
jgi:hypothetical protein